MEQAIPDSLFFDSHLHAFNLSHPSISAFLRRFLREFLRSHAKWRHIPLLAVVVAGGLAMMLLWIVFLPYTWCRFFAGRFASSSRDSSPG